MLVCPKCRLPLVRYEKTYHCSARHSYDIAKKGYVNLVLGNQKISGDSKEMVDARTLFLSAGYYQALADKLIELLKEIKPDMLIDAGCGEGYYTRQFHDCGNQIIAFDLSKPALNTAAKLDRDTIYAIASIFDMPIGDASADCVVNIFAPTPIDEVNRILKKGGILIKVGPGAKHLHGLKEVLYDEVYDNEEESVELKGLTHIQRVNVTDQIHLISNDQIKALFMMTPYYWKMSQASAARLNTLTELSTEIDFLIDLYQK